MAEPLSPKAADPEIPERSSRYLRFNWKAFKTLRTHPAEQDLQGPGCDRMILMRGEFSTSPGEGPMTRVALVLGPRSAGFTQQLEERLVQGLSMFLLPIMMPRRRL